MNEAVPAIYTIHEASRRVSLMPRLLALGVGMTCLAVLWIGAGIQPNPSGMGSHTDLGLTKCQFLGNSGLPCPSCGMTTSFAWFVRGNLAASVYVQPMGALLAMMSAITFWIAFYIALTGRPIHRAARFLSTGRFLFAILLFAALAWAWKIFIHLQGWDGWG